MKKRWLSMGLCGMMAVSLLSGCGSAGNADGKQKIGIAMPAQSLERWNRDGAYLKEAFEKEGYQVDLVYSDNDAAKQKRDLEKLIEKEPDLLVIAAIDGEGLADELRDVDVPVISYDRLIRNTDAVSYYISYDNYKVGELQGQYIIDTLDLGNTGKKTFNMEVTSGDLGDNNAVF
ncbi:MAG: substrate-binding domain-containing protein, partial [Lachnospiraceae bacterium]|nr:substrate-binding domain-containing protein [Lachnospiraceae bacterium]